MGDDIIVSSAGSFMEYDRLLFSDLAWWIDGSMASFAFRCLENGSEVTVGL